MTFQKSPTGLVEAFDRALPDDPRLERRKMFGCPCAFVGGNMFAGAFGSGLFVRLAEAERRQLLAEQAAGPFEPMPGRVMKEYVVLSERLAADPDALRGWVERAFAHAAALPPKDKAPRRAPKPASSAPRRRAAG